jgi:hypothetical protein
VLWTQVPVLCALAGGVRVLNGAVLLDIATPLAPR